MFNFRSDYATIGSPKILQALLDYASIPNLGYGEDEITKELEQKVQKLTGQNVHIYLVSGGTIANKIVISKMLKDYEAIISVESGHINVHETGAIESDGHKIITVKGKNGKIRAEDIEEVMQKYSGYHMVKIKAVYISNSTEIGTIYNKEELTSLSLVCKKYNLYLYLDGARLSIALTSTSNDLTLKDIATLTDVFYLGGTKNGLPYGEMIIIKNKKINDDFLYHLKCHGGMLSKTFVLSYLFLEFLKDDYYLTLAKNANLMASFLRESLTKLPLKIVYPNDTNQIFLELPKDIVKTLLEKFNFEIWEEHSLTTIIRLVTSFSTDLYSCETLIKELQKNLANY